VSCGFQTYRVQIGPFDVQFGPKDRSDRKPFRDIEAQMYLGHGLTFLGHVTLSIT